MKAIQNGPDTEPPTLSYKRTSDRLAQEHGLSRLNIEVQGDGNHAVLKTAYPEVGENVHKYIYPTSEWETDLED